LSFTRQHSHARVRVPAAANGVHSRKEGPPTRCRLPCRGNTTPQAPKFVCRRSQCATGESLVGPPCGICHSGTKLRQTARGRRQEGRSSFPPQAAHLSCTIAEISLVGRVRPVSPIPSESALMRVCPSRENMEPIIKRGGGTCNAYDRVQDAWTSRGRHVGGTKPYTRRRGGTNALPNVQRDDFRGVGPYELTERRDGKSASIAATEA